MATTVNFLFSYSIMNRFEGNFVENLDARSIAMGSATICGETNLFQSLINPANLVNVKSKFGFQTSGNFLVNTDNRALPMYNSFDGFSGEATYVSNVNLYDGYAFGAYYREKFISAAIVYHPFVSFESNYFEQVRNNANSNNNNYPPILAKNYLNGTGGIDALSFIVAGKMSIATLGCKLSKLSGNSHLERKIIWDDWAINEISDLQNDINYSDRNFEAFSTQFGANFQISERMMFGLSFTPKIEFDVSGFVMDTLGVDSMVFVYTKYDSLANPTDSLTFGDYTIPQKFRFGLNYQPRNIMRTNFNLDVEFVKWSDVCSLYEDATNFYLGVEHKLTNSIPFRFGFNYRTDYILSNHDGFTFADKVTLPTFSVGTGFEILDKFTFDFGLELTNRQYETLDLFMDSHYDYEELWANPQYLNFADRDWSNPDLVKETFLNLQTSISYKW